MRTKTVGVMELRRGVLLYTHENNTLAAVERVVREPNTGVVRVDVIDLDPPCCGMPTDVEFKESDKVEVALMPGWIIAVEEKSSSKIVKYLEYEFVDGLRWGGAASRWAAKRFLCAEDAWECVNRHGMRDEYHVFVEFEK